MINTKNNRRLLWQLGKQYDALTARLKVQYAELVKRTNCDDYDERRQAVNALGCKIDALENRIANLRRGAKVLYMEEISIPK